MPVWVWVLLGLVVLAFIVWMIVFAVTRTGSKFAANNNHGTTGSSTGSASVSSSASISSSTGAIQPTGGVEGSVVRTYNGSAGVGDFLSLSVDSASRIIRYQNLSNHQMGAVSYTVGAGGLYLIDDPSGILKTALELPGFGMLVEIDQAGPSEDQKVLVIALASPSDPLTVNSIAEGQYVYMQFQSTNGGSEVGLANILRVGDNGLSVEHQTYSLLAETLGSNGIRPVDMFALPSLTSAPINSLQISDADITPYYPDATGMTYVFGDNIGSLAMDTANGSMIMFPASTESKLPLNAAGSYMTMLYYKVGAQTVENVETGSAQTSVDVIRPVLALSGNGNVTISLNSLGDLFVGTLQPVSSRRELYGAADQLLNPCNGMFVARNTTQSAKQTLFFAFHKGWALISYIDYPTPPQTNPVYNYFYGAGWRSSV